MDEALDELADVLEDPRARDGSADGDDGVEVCLKTSEGAVPVRVSNGRLPDGSEHVAAGARIVQRGLGPLVGVATAASSNCILMTVEMDDDHLRDGVVSGRMRVHEGRREGVHCRHARRAFHRLATDTTAQFRVDGRGGGRLGGLVGDATRGHGHLSLLTYSHAHLLELLRPLGHCHLTLLLSSFQSNCFDLNETFHGIA